MLSSEMQTLIINPLIHKQMKRIREFRTSGDYFFMTSMIFLDPEELISDFEQVKFRWIRRQPKGAPLDPYPVVRRLYVDAPTSLSPIILLDEIQYFMKVVSLMQSQE